MKHYIFKSEDGDTKIFTEPEYKKLWDKISIPQMSENGVLGDKSYYLDKVVEIETLDHE